MVVRLLLRLVLGGWHWRYYRSLCKPLAIETQGSKTNSAPRVASSKANYITLLTGISHEKLQVFHRWASWAMFVLALIHTFPFIVFHIWTEDMMMQWKMSVVYWTGTVALIAQAYLNIMSIGVIRYVKPKLIYPDDAVANITTRNHYYEFFKATHHIVICVFIFFFFIHCDFRLTSWGVPSHPPSYN